MTAPAEPRGTQVRKPDPDWDKMRETVLMMELAVGQIEAAMRDSDSSVQVLTETFTTMARHMGTIGESAAQLPDDGTLGELKQRMAMATHQVTGMVHQSIIAFQFYDRLVQRLSHVSHGLESLANLVSDENRATRADGWLELQEQIRARYSMPEEVEMFEAVLLHGMSVQQALQIFMEKMKNKDDDIELF
jgi:predicted nucleic acid-binding protein